MRFKKIAVIFGILLVIVVGLYYKLNPEINKLDKKEREKLGGTYIKLSDGYTHYKLTGLVDSQLVILVHGGTIPSWTWTKQIRVLNDAGYRVLVYDKFGRGYSDRPNVTYNQELYKRQLFELVDKLGLNKKFDLIGLSVGGGTVVNFTAQYPDRVRKLVLVSPLINNFKLPFVFKIPVVGELIARFVGVKTIVKRFSSLIKGSPDSEKYKKLFIEQTTYKGFQKSLLSMLRNNAVKDYSEAYRTLGKQKRDILLIWGTNDTEITKEMIKDIRSLLPNVKFKPVDNAGHGVVFQKHKVVNSLITDFLK